MSAEATPPFDPNAIVTCIGCSRPRQLVGGLVVFIETKSGICRFCAVNAVGIFSGAAFPTAPAPTEKPMVQPVTELPRSINGKHG